MRPFRASIVVIVGAMVGTYPEAESHAVSLTDYRSIDGSNNNLGNPQLGRTFTPLLRKTHVAYELDAVADGTDEAPSGSDRPSAREISNAVVAQSQSIPNTMPISSFVWQWGQFIDHDIDLTPNAGPVEPFDIPVPAGDSFFDPQGTGTAVIILNRSAYDYDVDDIRQQINVITSYIDGSQVYGSDPRRAAVLRAFDDKLDPKRQTRGSLATSRGNLLPFNTTGLPNAPDTSNTFFLAGDERANEQIDLTAMHTLFVREHNYWAKKFSRDSSLDDEAVYQLARAFVAAEIQKITYEDWLPIVIGKNALPPHRGYDPTVDPRIANVFSTAAFRFGHSMLPNMLLRVGRDGNTIRDGNLSLQNAFFSPSLIGRMAQDLDSLLRGLAFQVPEEIDTKVVDGVRNFLFGPPGAGGFDLAALNIQRGRDHGLPGYNAVRETYGLDPLASFFQVTSDMLLANTLQTLYGSPDNADPWVALLAEDHVPGTLVGPTIRAILADQFKRLRDGDRYWYTDYLPAEMLAIVERQTLRDILLRNTGLGAELQENVFVAP